MTKHLTKPIRAFHFMVLAFLMTVGTQAMAINGRMNCKVKTNRVVEVSEGIGKEYPRFKDGFQVGDDLTLSYSFIEKEVVISLEDTQRTEYHWNNKIQIDADGVKFSNVESSDARIRTAVKGNHFGQELIASDGFHIIYHDNGRVSTVDGRVVLNRYYKNDWQGLVFIYDFEKLHVFTLDCRHQVDQLDKIITHLRIAAADPFLSK